MSLLQPSALWALAAIPLILLLYILRPRHRRQVVPSIRLWQHLPSDLEGRPRWRLPPASALLAAQLLVAGGLAVALARPALPGPVRQHLILLVDTSPTMLATDVAPNRLAVAEANARQLVGQLGPDDQSTLIAIAPTPRIIAAGQGPHALDAALSALTSAPARGDVSGALDLANQVARASSDAHNRVVVLSDGAFDGLTRPIPANLPADVSFQLIGGSDDNQGITALSARPMIGALNRYVGFIQVTNYSHLAAKLTLQVQADGLSIDRQALDLPARGHTEVSLNLPVGTHLLNASIGAGDAYHQDNQAQILVPNAQPIPVTLVSDSPGDWQHALQTLPNVRLTVTSPTSYKPNGATVTIFDGFVPAAVPSGNLLLIDPPRGNPLVSVTGELNNLSVVRTDSQSNLFDAVDLGGLYVPRADRFGAVPWAPSVADSSQGPLILSGDQNGRSVIVIGFDPSTTDWPQRTSFPVFVANAIDALAPSTIPTEITNGSVLDLPAAAQADQVLVQLPDGRVDLFAGGQPIRFTDTGLVGRYVVSEMNGNAVVARHEFVADHLGVDQSNIAPRVDPGQFVQQGGPAGKPSEHDLWYWVAGGALALMGLEWVAYFRRAAG